MHQDRLVTLKYSLNKLFAIQSVATFLLAALSVGFDVARVRSLRVELKERRRTFIAACEHGHLGFLERASIRNAEEANKIEATFIALVIIAPWAELNTGLATLGQSTEVS
jgi:hypothetical protein